MFLKTSTQLLLTLIISVFSCSDISEKTLAGTKWTNNENTIYCDFISRNTLDIMFNETINKYLFYIEDGKIKITDKLNYSQYIIEYKNENLFFDSEIVNITPKTQILLQKTDVIPKKNESAEQPANRTDNQPENAPITLPNNKPADSPF